MKRKTIRALLAGVLCALSVVPAGAVRVSDIAGLGALAAASAVGGALQEEGIATFRRLEDIVRANNQTIKSFELTLDGIENTDVSSQFFNQYLQYDAQRAQYEAQAAIYQQCIDELQGVGESSPAIDAQIRVAQMNLQSIAAIDAVIDSLDDAQEDAENELDETYATTEKQLENAANQIVVGAQTAYAGIITIREGIETLDRNLAALDRNIETVEKQVEIGMASDLTLENLRQTRRTAAAQRETLLKQQEATENQLSLLCGNTPAFRHGL